MSDDRMLKGDLAELHSNRALEIQFGSKSLEEYWCSAIVMLQRLYETAPAVLIAFATKYICELGFSSLLSILRRNLEIA